MSRVKEEEQAVKNPSLQFKFSKFKIIKNIVVLCVVFFVAFMAYDCLSMLQSTLNHEDGIGVICQALVYGCFCISALLLPKYVIKKLGCKLTLVFSMILYVPYIASNLYPHWSLMIPAAILNGFGASLLWGAQCQYLNEMAFMYASENADHSDTNLEIQKPGPHETEVKEKTEKAQNAYGVTSPHSNLKATKHHVSKTETEEIKNQKSIPFSDGRMLHCTSPEVQQEENTDRNVNIYFKNEVSFSKDSKFFPKLSQTVDSEKSRKKLQSVTAAKFFGIHGMAYLSTHMWSNLMSYFILQNDTLHTSSFLNSSCVCGAQFCNEKSNCLVQNLQEPSPETRTFLTGLCTGLGLISIVFLALLLDPLNDRKEVKFSLAFLLATSKHLRKKKQIFLTPLSFYVGMMQGFYTGDFNMSFVGCAWGTAHVGLVSVCYGAACAASSSLSGCVIRYTGRPPIILFSAVINIISQILLLVWRPNAENPIIFFLIAGLWGTSVGIFWSQMKAIYGFLFKNEEEVAFAAYHLWYSLGFCLSFSYSNHLCTYLKIFILMSVLILGIIGYICVEIILRQKIKHEKLESYSYFIHCTLHT